MGEQVHLVYLLDWTKASGRIYVGKTNDLKTASAGLATFEECGGGGVQKNIGTPEVVILHRCELRAEGVRSGSL